VLQAVSYEFQSKPGNIFGPKVYRLFLFLNGVLATFLLGVVVGTFFTGAEFSVGKSNIAGLGSSGFVISQWQNPLHGLEALANVRNLCLGFAILFLARTQASLYFVNRLEHEVLEKRSRKFVLYNGVPFVVFFLIFLIWTLLGKGYAVDSASKVVSLEEMKYLHNFIDMPLVAIIFVLGVVAVLYGILRTVFQSNFKKGIWYSGVGTVLVVTMLLLITGYNNTAYYPSSVDLQSSLTLANSSSSEFTLSAMAVVSLFVPVVLAYIIYAWRALEKKKLRLEDLENDGHTY
jgi:cytochrome d ubiquinol oxidase subunit II